MSVKLPFAGGCVCGAVRYEVTAAPPPPKSSQALTTVTRS